MNLHGEEVKCGELCEGADHGVEEVYHVFVLPVVCETLDVECRRARRVLGKLSRFIFSDERETLLNCLRRTSCAQKSLFGAPWLIQYLFTEKFVSPVQRVHGL